MKLQYYLQLLGSWSLSEADLRRVDLRGADLREVDLRGADLRKADLYEVDLHEVDLRGANLYEVNLSGAVGVLNPAEFLAARFTFDESGLIAYKMFDAYYPFPSRWRIEPGSVITEVVNPDRGTDCGSGINIAPRNWSGFNNFPMWKKWKVRVAWRDLAGVIVPFGSDGKIRCGRCTLLQEVMWE